MINRDTLLFVKNRSSSVVVYRIPETNLRREFQPGETKRVPFNELEKLTYQPGGREILEHFLQVIEEQATDDLNIHREPEYNLSESQIQDLIIRGSLDAFLDALDFAPVGVIDLIKTYSVSIPLTDLNKRKALKEKTGFDVDKALIHIEEEKDTEKTSGVDTHVAAPATGRRTAANYKVEEPVRRETAPAEDTSVGTSTPTLNKYKVVSKG